jgi:hypothetical protein
MRHALQQGVLQFCAADCVTSVAVRFGRPIRGSAARARSGPSGRSQRRGTAARRWHFQVQLRICASQNASAHSANYLKRIAERQTQVRQFRRGAQYALVGLQSSRHARARATQKRNGNSMDNFLVDQLLKAKKQLKITRFVTIGATVCWLGGAIAAVMLTGFFHDFASAFSYASLGSAFLISTDLPLQGGGGTRAALIRAIETQINRDPNALKELSDRARQTGHLAG